MEKDDRGICAVTHATSLETNLSVCHLERPSILTFDPKANSFIQFLGGTPTLCRFGAGY